MREAREKDSDAIVEMMDVWCRELVDTGGAVEREMDKVRACSVGVWPILDRLTDRSRNLQIRTEPALQHS